MARSFRIFVKMCEHAKDNLKFITDFLFENNYDTDENLKKGYAKLVKHDLIEDDD